MTTPKVVRAAVAGMMRSAGKDDKSASGQKFLDATEKYVEGMEKAGKPLPVVRIFDVDAPMQKSEQDKMIDRHREQQREKGYERKRGRGRSRGRDHER